MTVSMVRAGDEVAARRTTGAPIRLRMKIHHSLVLAGTLLSFASALPSRGADLIQLGNIVVNPPAGSDPAVKVPVQLSLQGPAFDNSGLAPGWTLGYVDDDGSNPLMPTSVGIFRLQRTAGRYQWQFTTLPSDFSAGGDGRLAMELGNDHSLTLLDPHPENDAPPVDIRIVPGSGGGVFVAGVQLATVSQVPNISSRLVSGLHASAPNTSSFALGPYASAISGGLLSPAFAFGDHASATAKNIAMGHYASATGTGGAIAMGDTAHADGVNTVAFGANSVATGEGAISLGTYAYATGAGALSLGGAAYGDYATALGGSWAYANTSLAAGWGTANGQASIALGGYTEGFKSFAGNSGSAYGECATAFGVGTLAYLPQQFAFGAYNDPGATAARPVAAGDFLFTIGNGSAQSGQPVVRSNAFTVGYNGDTGIQGGIHVQGGPVSAPVTSTFDQDVSVKGVLRVPESGDLSMGAFTTGPQP